MSHDTDDINHVGRTAFGLSQKLVLDRIMEYYVGTGDMEAAVAYYLWEEAGYSFGEMRRELNLSKREANRLIEMGQEAHYDA
jgi:hypothetical protein